MVLRYRKQVTDLLRRVRFTAVENRLEHILHMAANSNSASSLRGFPQKNFQFKIPKQLQLILKNIILEKN